jgi:hypothetical protein
VAAKEAEAADHHAAKMATEKFTNWINEGPANGLRRQHLFSRCATGWAPSKVGVQPDPELNDHDDLEGVSQEEIIAAINPSTTSPTPLGAQMLANSERKDWCKQWASDAAPDVLHWPDDIELEQLPPLRHNVLVYLVAFLRELLQPAHAATNQLTAATLSEIFGSALFSAVPAASTEVSRLEGTFTGEGTARARAAQTSTPSTRHERREEVGAILNYFLTSRELG